MITGLLLMGGLMAATYAVNAWKIQMVADGRAVCAAALEGSQGLLFIIALTTIIDLPSSSLGALAYVAGAFIGTAAAVAIRTRKSEVTSCPCTGTPLVRDQDQPAPQVHLPSS